jgi:hypothetical protein
LRTIPIRTDASDGTDRVLTYAAEKAKTVTNAANTIGSFVRDSLKNDLAQHRRLGTARETFVPHANSHHQAWAWHTRYKGSISPWPTSEPGDWPPLNGSAMRSAGHWLAFGSAPLSP